MPEQEESTIVDLDVDVPDPVAVAEAQYEIIQRSASVRQQRPEKGTGKYIFVLFEIAGETNAKMVTHVMMFPQDSDDEKTVYNRRLAIRQYYEALSISVDGNAADLSTGNGNSTFAFLTCRTDPEYGDQNSIRRFISAE